MTTRGEDKPLLVSILDGGRGSKGSDDEAYIDTKSLGMIKRWKYSGKNGSGRGKGIMMGAASVIKRWPDYLTLCWLIAVAFCMIIIAGIFLLESSMKPPVPQSFSALSIQQKCLARHDAIIKNGPQKFSDKTNIYLHVILNGKESFNVKKYKTLFTSVVQNHPNHFINVYVLYNDTKEMEYQRNARFKDWELYQNAFDVPRFFETSSADEEQNAIIPFHAQRVATDIIDFENINIIRSSLSSYFLHSPLRFRWRILPDSIIPFMLRVLTLWEHGGITMPWQLFKDKTDIYCVKKDVTGQFRDIVDGFQKKDLFAKNDATTTHMTKQQIADDIRTIGDTNDVTIERNFRIEGEHLRRFNFNDTDQLDPPSINILNRKPLPRKVKHIAGQDEKAKKLAKLLKGHKPGEHAIKKPKNGGSKDKDDDSEEGSYPSSSSGNSNYIEKLRKKFLVDNKESKDLSTTEKKIRKLLKNPQLRKKLTNMNVNNAMQKDSRLKRIKRELRPFPEDGILQTTNQPNELNPSSTANLLKLALKKKTLPPRNSAAVKMKTNLTDKIKSVRYKPPNRSRSHKSLTRSMDDSSFYDSSDYYTSSSASYSGYVAVRKFKHHPQLPTKKGLEWPKSSSSMYKHVFKTSQQSKNSAESSVKTAKGLASSASDSSYSVSTEDYFKEKKAYVNHKIFDMVNVFSLPNKLSLTTDRFGYYFSTKKPCHAFLGELISMLQSSNELKSPDGIVDKGLKVFCKGHKFNDCMGITLL